MRRSVARAGAGSGSRACPLHAANGIVQRPTPHTCARRPHSAAIAIPTFRVGVLYAPVFYENCCFSFVFPLRRPTTRRNKCNNNVSGQVHARTAARRKYNIMITTCACVLFAAPARMLNAVVLVFARKFRIPGHGFRRAAHATVKKRLFCFPLPVRTITPTPIAGTRSRRRIGVSYHPPRGFFEFFSLVFFSIIVLIAVVGCWFGRPFFSYSEFLLTLLLVVQRLQNTPIKK